ncbi:MAG: hypothetical protein GY938_14240 [Ketobacter sp.]|nr:hypothetical protein [Ketobacter sp.]
MKKKKEEIALKNKETEVFNDTPELIEPFVEQWETKKEEQDELKKNLESELDETKDLIVTGIHLNPVIQYPVFEKTFQTP